MTQSDLYLESDLRLSPKMVLIFVLIVGCCLVLLVQALSPSWDSIDRVLWYFLALCGFVLLGWQIFEWNSILGRWFIFGGLSMLIWTACRIFKIPELTILEGFPIAIMIVMINIRAAALSTIIETALLLIFRNTLFGEINTTILCICLATLWITLLFAYTIYRPVNQLLIWLNQYFWQTNTFMEEVRNSKEETAHALESLANANRQLALANKKMAVLNTIAEEAQKAKSIFVANVSHEFRTPLNMIVGLIDLMMKSPEIYDVLLSPKMREDFEVIYRNCEHLSNMINDVLDLTRVETGRFALHREWVDLLEIVDKATIIVKPLITKKCLFLNTECPESLPKIYCDRIRIQQVILNLFSNAARFTEEGGISIRIFQEDQRIVLTISDTGPGIDSEDAKRVFEPFWQGRSATWQQKGGSGLGLNLSREFVKLHGGQMWFESQPDKGTTFFLYLPISPFLEPVVKPDRYNKDDWIWRESSFKSSQISIDNPTSKPRLILCDETDTLYTRFLYFSDQVEFINLRSLHNINNENSAQALVINVPSVEQLWPQVEKAINETTATPIVGCCIPVEKEQALSSGAIGYLIKPVTLEDLKHAIETVGKPIHRILLVDDDADVLRLFSRMIFTYDKNIEVQTASSGRRALELINQWTPDLLLLDIVMPEMTGWQVLETIQRNPRFAGISTYFVTAQDPTGPLNSAFFFASIKGGISLHKLLQCSLVVSSLLMEPEQGPDLMPE